MTEWVVTHCQSEAGNFKDLEALTYAFFAGKVASSGAIFSLASFNKIIRDWQVNTQHCAFVDCNTHATLTPSVINHVIQLSSFSSIIDLLHSNEFTELVLFAYAEDEFILPSGTFDLDSNYSKNGASSGFIVLHLVEAKTAQKKQLPELARLSHCYQARLTDDLNYQLKFIDQQFSPELICLHSEDTNANQQLLNHLPRQLGSLPKKALTSSQSQLGRSSQAGFNALADLLSLIVAVNRAFFPVAPNWHGSVFEDSRFFVCTESRPWLTPSRSAWLCYLEKSLCTHFVITQGQDYIPMMPMRYHEEKLFLFSAQSTSSLAAQLTTFKLWLSKTTDCYQLAMQCFADFKADNVTLALIAKDIESLDKELTTFINEINQGERTMLKTPKGSCLVTKKTTKKISFLYPGIGASYCYLGQSLCFDFPHLMDLMKTKTDNLAQSLQLDEFFPVSFSRITPLALTHHSERLRKNLPVMAEAGVAYACLYTALYQDILAVKADCAAGYSMGEVSMFAALSVWENPSELSPRLNGSKAFNNMLAGNLTVLKDNFGHPRQWETYSLSIQFDQLSPIVAKQDRVFCTIINTHKNCIIAGYPEDCQQMAKALKIKAIPLQMSNVIHSPPAEACYDELVSLYTLPVNKAISVEIYSSSCYLKVPSFSQSIAHSLARCLVDQVDFPRLIYKLDEAGCNLFMEIGPGNSLSGFVRKILGHDNIVSLSTDVKGNSDWLSLLKAVAILVSQGVSINLTTLFSDQRLLMDKRKAINE